MEGDKQEEVLWRQKSRVRWLKEGEKNTKFFHHLTIQRRMINTITHIQNNQGAKVEDHAAIEKELLSYFKQVHQETQMDRSVAIDKKTQSIPKITTEEHNQLLLKPISLQEVEKVVRELKEGKALSSDMFTSNFFHKFWDMIKLEVW